MNSNRSPANKRTDVQTADPHTAETEPSPEQHAAIKFMGALRAAGLDGGGGTASIDANLLVPTLAAAGLIGIKQQTLALWRCERLHALPYVKVGSRVLYRFGDLRKFIDSRTLQSPKAA